MSKQSSFGLQNDSRRIPSGEELEHDFGSSNVMERDQCGEKVKIPRKEKLGSNGKFYNIRSVKLGRSGVHSWRRRAP